MAIVEVLASVAALAVLGTALRWGWVLGAATAGVAVVPRVAAIAPTRMIGTVEHAVLMARAVVAVNAVLMLCAVMRFSFCSRPGAAAVAVVSSGVWFEVVVVERGDPSTVTRCGKRVN